MQKGKGQHYKVNPERIFYDSIKQYQNDYHDELSPFVVFYKGEVVDNEDPLQRGRLKLRVVFFDQYVEESDLSWYDPSIMGSCYYLPKKGDIVYVTFEDAKNRIGGMWWSYYIRRDQWDWRVNENMLLFKVKGSGSEYEMDPEAADNADRELMLINTEDSMIKVHSEFILFSQKGWEEAGEIPPSDFIALNGRFVGDKAKVTIHAERTFLGNDDMDFRTWVKDSFKELADTLQDMKSTFDKHKHFGVQSGGGATPSTPTKMKGYKIDQMEQKINDMADRFLTSNGDPKE